MGSNYSGDNFSKIFFIIDHLGSPFTADEAIRNANGVFLTQAKAVKALMFKACQSATY